MGTLTRECGGTYQPLIPAQPSTQPDPTFLITGRTASVPSVPATPQSCFENPTSYIRGVMQSGRSHQKSQPPPDRAILWPHSPVPASQPRPHYVGFRELSSTLTSCFLCPREPATQRQLTRVIPAHHPWLEGGAVLPGGQRGGGVPLMELPPPNSPRFPRRGASSVGQQGDHSEDGDTGGRPWEHRLHSSRQRGEVRTETRAGRQRMGRGCHTDTPRQAGGRRTAQPALQVSQRQRRPPF